MVLTELNIMPFKIKLVKRTKCYRLTWLGYSLLSISLFIAVLFAVISIPKFLSQPKPLNGEILVLDGLMPDYAVKKAIDIFHSGNYERIVTTGGNLSIGYAISDIKSMAGLTYATFIKMGFDSTKISCLPTGNVLRNRTYSSALKLDNWLKSQNIQVQQIDVLAVGCHAARSKYLFEMALGDQIEVGVVVVEDLDYDIDRWWQTSKGLRTVLSEGLGYFYVRFFFLPRKD